MPRSELVQSVLRGLSIVQTVAQSEAGLGLRELSGALGLKPTTVHNLARTLLAARFLERTNDRPRYRLGPAVLELASAHWDRSFMQAASVEVVKLSRTLDGATVVLAEAAGGEVMTRLRMSPERPGVLERPRHRPMHPYGTASALVFQAFWTDEERGEFRERYPFAVFGAHIWKGAKRLDEALAGVRKRGYAAPGRAGTGGRPVAAPIFGPGGELVASLGASAPPGKRRKELIGKVVQAAGRLSAAE